MISAPLRSRASTTTVTADSPAMMRLRAGNRHGAGSTRGAYSETARPDSRIRARQLGMGRRVVTVDAAAEHRDRRASGLESAPMRLPVHAAREAADDDEPSCRELPTEQPRDLGAVRRARSGAHDGDGRPQQRLGSGGAAHEETWRRIVDRSEQRREVRVGAAEPANSGPVQASEVRGLVERPDERPERSVARHLDHVGVARSRERRDRHLAHRALSSVGDRYESASAR